MEATEPLRRAERSPPRAARLPRPRLRVQVAVATGLAGPRGLPGPSDHRGLPPAPSAPLPAASSGLRARPAGEGTGRGSGEVGARTSKHPARPAEPQEGGEQEEAAGPEPPHPAATAPRPKLAPRWRRSYLRRPLPAPGRDPERDQGAPPPTSAGARPGRGKLPAARSCCAPSRCARRRGARRRHAAGPEHPDRLGTDRTRVARPARLVLRWSLLCVRALMRNGEWRGKHSWWR